MIKAPREHSLEPPNNWIVKKQRQKRVRIIVYAVLGMTIVIGLLVLAEFWTEARYYDFWQNLQ